MALLTGSVVVPSTSETIARFWPVTALTRLDFPALRRPKKPMCTLFAEGVLFISFAIVLLSLPGRVVAPAHDDFVSRAGDAVPQALHALGRLFAGADLVVVQ